MTAEIREPIVATFFAPYGARSLPAVIVLGGSEGGINRDAAALLASHGFAALAVAYFGAGSLPEQLDRIPLESIDRAVEWLRAQPSVDAKRIAIAGGSKGAELALLVAAHNPAVRAVVAIAPSSVVYPSITGGKHVSSSWTVGGKELPYAPYVTTEAFQKSNRLVDLYAPTLAAAPPEAAIPVEKIHGPVLLLAGKDDALWPSGAMAEQIERRAHDKHAAFPVINMTMVDAGHHVARDFLWGQVESRK
jgi:dienelactone hydrolase